MTDGRISAAAVRGWFPGTFPQVTFADPAAVSAMGSAELAQAVTSAVNTAVAAHGRLDLASRVALAQLTQTTAPAARVAADRQE